MGGVSSQNSQSYNNNSMSSANSVSSNAFDQRFRQNQAANNDPFGQVSDVGSQALGFLGAGLTKTWGFATNVAASATEKVQSGQLKDLTNKSLSFVGDVAKASVNTASNVVTGVKQNMAQDHDENPEFWNNFGSGSKNVTPSNSGGFGGFGGGGQNDSQSQKQQSQKQNENVNDNYWDNFGEKKTNNSGGFAGFGSSSNNNSSNNKGGDGWDDW